LSDKDTKRYERLLGTMAGNERIFEQTRKQAAQAEPWERVPATIARRSNSARGGFSASRCSKKKNAIAPAELATR